VLHSVYIHANEYKCVYSFFPVRSSTCNVNKACVALRILFKINGDERTGTWIYCFVCDHADDSVRPHRKLLSSPGSGSFITVNFNLKA
jgi:hypothetical protein